MAKRRIKESGFTLIELMIGAVIVFIISVFIITTGTMIYYGLFNKPSGQVEIITQDQEAQMNQTEKGPIYD